MDKNKKKDANGEKKKQQQQSDASKKQTWEFLLLIGSRIWRQWDGI